MVPVSARAQHWVERYLVEPASQPATGVYVPKGWGQDHARKEVPKARRPAARDDRQGRASF